MVLLSEVRAVIICVLKENNYNYNNKIKTSSVVYNRQINKMLA